MAMNRSELIAKAQAALRDSPAPRPTTGPLADMEQWVRTGTRGRHGFLADGLAVETVVEIPQSPRVWTIA